MIKEAQYCQIQIHHGLLKKKVNYSMKLLNINLLHIYEVNLKIQILKPSC